MEICEDLEINPIINASLAVFAYTNDTEMEINDIDLLIPEIHFKNLANSLKRKNIEFHIKEWHVLRVIKSGLKIEFDSMDYWEIEWGIHLPDAFSKVRIQGLTMDILDLPHLIQTYKIGAEKSTKRSKDYRMKYKALKRVQDHVNKEL